MCPSIEYYEGHSPLLFAELAPERKSVAISLPSFLPLRYLENAVSVIGKVLVMNGFLCAQAVSVSGAMAPLIKPGCGAEVVSLSVGLWETRSKHCLCLANEQLNLGAPPLCLCDNPTCPDCSTLCVEISSRSVVLPQG